VLAITYSRKINNSSRKINNRTIALEVIHLDYGQAWIVKASTFEVKKFY
jgi:hypothetical protein